MNNTVEDLYICAGDGASVDVVDKDTLVLTTLNGNFVLDYDEIADKYSLNVNSVKAKYFRALKKCNKAMKGDK